MAQTRKRRRTKHRGNAAGMVESRGRTGRRPEGGGGSRASAGAGRPTTREQARARRADRMSRPPTWRAAFSRALISAVIFVPFAILALHAPAVSALALGVFVLLLYVPLGYVVDKFVYERRIAKQSAR